MVFKLTGVVVEEVGCLKRTILGEIKMKEIMGLYMILIAIYFVNLTNITLFNAEWNGIAMWLSTGLFIAGTAYYLMSRDSIKKNK